MSQVKLEETKDRRRLHIGSYFVDLNEADYRELVRIFSDQSHKADVIQSGVIDKVTDKELRRMIGYALFIRRSTELLRTEEEIIDEVINTARSHKVMGLNVIEDVKEKMLKSECEKQRDPLDSDNDDNCGRCRR